MKFPVIVLGTGGHAKVLVVSLLASSTQILGFVDPAPFVAGQTIRGILVIGPDEEIMQYRPDSLQLVNGIGSVGYPQKRIALFDKFNNKGYTFGIVVHPSAVIPSDIALGEGAQIMAGAVVQPGCRIGRNVIINTGVCVDHDCDIGDHVHLAPGVTLSGDVSIGEGSHVGTGSTVIQGVRIGKNCIIGAGSLVLKDTADGITIAGNPAKVLEK